MKFFIKSVWCRNARIYCKICKKYIVELPHFLDLQKYVVKMHVLIDDTISFALKLQRYSLEFQGLILK